MALGSLDLRVSKSDFETRIGIAEASMASLEDVITRYGEAKDNLNQFIEESDDNYQAMIDRIDVNIKNAKKAYAALDETRKELLNTINQMEGMSEKVKDTITSATEAVSSVVEAGFKVEALL